ncbi:alpha/beta hydrolase fold domain-containing protein [Planococcus liqunii]|uniref:alpha/beta hydrolase fold domain-containing protein n=1 Tax=Planococcus liqunii TaxID=3058394 RepID=UPI0026091178|nr:alpha/beta hydrolase fold domain-containing protein [Planococcus sp. N056]WKA52257.1 alpha/beta hydrolase fold domain-containing protein [Planococcus sp. N056]
MNIKTRTYALLVGLVFIFLTLAQTFFINYLIPLGLAAFAVSVLNVWIMKKLANRKLFRLVASVTAVYVVAEILWMFFDKIGLFVLAQVSFVLIGFVLVALGLGIHRKKERNVLSVILGIVKWIALIVLIGVSSLMILLTATPKPFTSYFQSVSGDYNSYEAEEPSTTTIIEGNYQLTNNLQYGDNYPRSYLDIMTPAGEFDQNRPTYFYVHGGGFIAGDKLGGDPNASASENSGLYHYKVMIDHGYNVVALNYALAPEYTHPTPTKQLTEAVQFMQENGEQYGINMNDVVFAGGSAGGYIAADFTTIQANPEYAEEIGIEPVMELEDIKGLVLEVPTLDPTRASKTTKEVPFSDYIFGQSLAAFLGESLVSPDEDLVEATNLIPKATSEFPPTFLTDGNTGSFADQSIDYYNRLTELGVKTELYIPDINESEEIHGYMSTIDSKATKTYVEKKLKFLDSLN